MFFPSNVTVPSSSKPLATEPCDAKVEVLGLTNFADGGIFNPEGEYNLAYLDRVVLDGGSAIYRVALFENEEPTLKCETENLEDAVDEYVRLILKLTAGEIDGE